jgi:autotransporter-associated beta strand protein
MNGKQSGQLMQKQFLAAITSLLFVGQSAAPLWAVDDVAGTMFTLTTTATAPNGAWSWFEDERAIIDSSDPNNPLLLVSSVSSAADGNVESGDIDLLWRNLTTGAQGEFELHDRLERDDHDSAALYLRPDGRYLAMYSKHITDNLTRWRISTNPHDPTSWQPMQALNNGAGTTYDNIYHLAGDNNGAGRTYNFTRANGFDPVVQTSNDHGSTWTNAGQLLTQGDGNDRPYVRYASDGKKIHFISTEEHPRDFANSVYHGYIQDGKLYNTNGSLIDNNLFDPNAVSPTALTKIFQNGSTSNGTTMNRAWTISLEVDNTGNPVGVFSARANDNNNDHRFFYGRYDGNQWQVNEFAKAGGFLYASESDYTGLVAIDPENPNVLVMSSKIDPRSDTTTNKYELYKGVTSNFGANWTWSAITENSTVDNVRPIIPEWNGLNTALTWMRGTFSTYTSWTTEVVGISYADQDPKALLWRGSGPGVDAWDVNTSSHWDSGGDVNDVYQQGYEVAFDDTADNFFVEIAEPVSPMGVAFNNSNNDYVITGAGIAGSGGLRVLGTGTVTLNNDANSYTGETLITGGDLQLMGDATLTNTSHIRVKPNGRLDVNNLDGNEFQLSGQSLTNEGTTSGNIKATNNSVVSLAEDASHFGGMTVNQSTLTGEGTFTYNLTAEAGATIRVGDVGFDLDATLGPATYIDATSGVSGNTTFANGATFTPPLNGTTGTDNQWEQRTVLGSNGNIFESGGEAVENAPQLKTTLTNLTPTVNYEVSALFWDANGDVEDWNIRAGFAPANMTFFANGTTTDATQLGATGAAIASSIPYVGVSPMFTESNRVLLSGVVGTAVANANGQIEVFIDDMPSPIGANNRTWYDGLAVRMVSYTTNLVVDLEVNGDYVQDSDAALELDIFSPTILDRLEVEGQLSASGTLAVSLADGAPLPQHGDTFEILGFGSFSGEFDQYELPPLELGLAWNVSNLGITGELEVVRDADLDNDGDVDGRDFLLLQRLDPLLTVDWQVLYGSQLVTPLLVASAVIPEPATCSLLCLASAGSGMMRLRLFSMFR